MAPCNIRGREKETQHRCEKNHLVEESERTRALRGAKDGISMRDEREVREILARRMMKPAKQYDLDCDVVAVLPMRILFHSIMCVCCFFVHERMRKLKYVNEVKEREKRMLRHKSLSIFFVRFGREKEE